MEKYPINYFLFPGLIIPEEEFRNFFVFLPRLNFLEISRPAAVPEWAREKFFSRPAIADQELMGQIKSCSQGYRAFAEIHGGSGGNLGYLSRALEDMSDTRFGIQEQLRGKCPAGLDAKQIEVLRAAVFLDIARELDEKEFELASGIAEAGALEKEFAEILGLTEEDDSEVPEDLDLPLFGESPGPQYMLPERIASWFQIFSAHMGDVAPVFVASGPEAAVESLDTLRTALDHVGKEFSSSTLALGSFPSLDHLGQKQFRSVIEAPGVPPILAAYQERLDLFLTNAASGKDIDALESEAAPLRQCLEKACRVCSVPGKDCVTLYLELVHGLSCGEAVEILSAVARTEPVSTAEFRDQPLLLLFLD